MTLAVFVQLFEGMKAFRGVDNRIRLFRPMMNMERMHRSADRSCLPVSPLFWLALTRRLLWGRGLGRASEASVFDPAAL